MGPQAFAGRLTGGYDRDDTRCSGTRDRTRVSRDFDRCAGHGDWRGRIQHGDDRLPGRSSPILVHAPDRHADLPPHRQYGHQSRGPRVGRHPRCGPRDPRPAACCTRTGGRHSRCPIPAAWGGGGHRRDRHPQADADPAREGCAGGLHRERRRQRRGPSSQCRPRGGSRASRAWTSPRSFRPSGRSSGTRAPTGRSSKDRGAAPDSACTWSPTITASSATSCGCWPTMVAG